MRKNANTLAENSLILMLSTILVKIISAFFKIPLASDNFLGEVGFGYFSVAHDLYAPFYLLAITGLPTAVSHIVAQKVSNNADNDIINTFYSCRRLFTILGVIISLAIILITLPLYLFLNSDRSSFYSIFAIIPSVFLCFTISAYRGYFEGYSNMYPTAISKLIEALFKLILGLLFSYLGLKITQNVAFASVFAITAITFGTAISTLYLHLKFKHENTTKPIKLKSYAKGQFKLYLRLSLPFVFAGLTASIVALLDVFFVKVPLSFVNESYVNTVILQNGELAGDFSTLLYGIRSQAFTLYNLIPTFTSALGVSALPIITAYFVKGDRQALKENINHTLKLISVVTFPSGIGLTVLSSEIMILLYSNSSILGVNLLKIYGISALFAGFAIPLITVLQALGKKRSTIINIVVAIFIKIISSLILVSYPKINIYAATFSTLMCYLYLFLSAFFTLYKTIGNFDFKNSLLKPLFAAVLCGFSALILSQISQSKIITILAILIAVAVYAITLLLTKTFSRNEISQFPLINKLFDK